MSQDREGSLMERLRLLMLKQDGHGDLRGSDHRSVIVTPTKRIVALLCVFFKLALNWPE
jgi:hypothetical protein